MSRYFINLLLLLCFTVAMGQKNEKAKDTVGYKDRYGLRVGADVVLPVMSFFDDNNKGFEIVADYRFHRRFYLATEFGYREHTRQEDFFNFSTKGQYIKLGVDYNAYKNWSGMENMIVVGLRYAFSNFDQIVNEYTINADPFLPERTETDRVTYEGLNASWAELVLGLKVEVLNNLFLGLSVRGNVMLSQQQPENFKNLYVPGFDRVFVNDFGYSFNYTVSYLIPFYRKK